MNRREFLKCAALSVAGAAAGCGKLPGRRKPNIVLIVADDLGYNDLSCYGSKDILSPAIDSIAAGGVRFTSFYANHPECTPTRTALLTGRYQHRVRGLECALGIGNVGRYDDAIRLRETHDMGLPPEETSIAKILKSVGYKTAIFGKWHLGYEPKFAPMNHGFDQAWYIIGGAVDYFHHNEYTGDHALFENGEPITREGYLTDLITEEAVKYVNEQEDTPFFLYVPYTAPHTPYQGPGDYRETPLKQEEYNIGTREKYVEMVEVLDKGVSKILSALEAKGLADNTLMIFMSDNGGAGKADNSPYRGNKGNVFEGGIRVPCAARWPGKIKPGTVSDQVCITMDFSWSILTAAGTRPPEDRPFDGMDILEQVIKNRPNKKRTLFWRARRGENTRKAVRDGDWKYLWLRSGDKVEEYTFNLSADPSETTNMLEKEPAQTERLKALLASWEKEVQHHR